MPCIQTARRYVEALTGDADAPMNVRLIHDSDKSMPAAKRHGTVASLGPEIEAFQAQGYGVFVVVVNEGGNSDQEITGVRVGFVDADGIPLPDKWHLQPDFIIQRDAGALARLLPEALCLICPWRNSVKCSNASPRPLRH